MPTINLQVSGTNRDGREIPGTVEQISTLRIAGSGHHAIHILANGSNMPPQGATIDVATLQLHVKTYTTAKFDIYVEDNVSPSDLNTSDSNDISNRSLLSSVVNVDETVTDNTWESWNITAAIQQLVNKGSWNTSRKIAVILKERENDNDFASDGWVGDPALAAKLDITYHTTETNSSFTGSPLSGLYATQVDDVAMTNNSSTTDPNGFTGGSAGWLWEYRIGAGLWNNFPSGATSFQPTLSNLSAGTYSVRLTATSNDGTSDTFTRTNYFTVQAARTATASFTLSATSYNDGDSVAPTNTSTTDDPGGIVSYEWQRKLAADSVWSTYAVVQSPVTVFAVGVWDIRLKVTSDLGATSTSASQQITVLAIAAQISSSFRPYGAPGAKPTIIAMTPGRPLIPIPATSGVVIECLIADPTGKVIAEINPDIRSAAWRLNGVSSVQFSLAKTDPKFIENYFRFRNRVFLRFDNGLPPWGGVIDDPRTWDLSSMIATASSGEQLLFDRLTSRTVSFKGVRVGTIFRTLLQQAHAYYPAGFVREGFVWGGGRDHSPTFHYENIGEAFDSLVNNLSAGAWDVTPKLETGRSGTRIEFEANLYGQRGRFLQNHALEEGANLIAWKGQDRANNLVNEWIMVGEVVGDTEDEWGDSRITSTLRDSASAGKHNLIQDFEARQGVTVQDTLDQTVTNRLSETKTPFAELALTVINQNPAKFGDYFIGDSMICEIEGFGFNGFRKPVLVKGIEFFDKGWCDLVVEIEDD